MKKKYIKFFEPQVRPQIEYNIPYDNKKKMVLIASNKSSNIKNELHTERKKAIGFYDGSAEFDLYGYGWENEGFKSYKGTVDKKHETLSKYKYCICYENMHGINGYITEKIFDCFFSNCVPIYWGADNITEYIPGNTSWRFCTDYV